LFFSQEDGLDWVANRDKISPRISKKAPMISILSFFRPWASTAARMTAASTQIHRFFPVYLDNALTSTGPSYDGGEEKVSGKWGKMVEAIAFSREKDYSM